MMQAALHYARFGWPILPVVSGKAPICDHGVHSATTDEGQIRKWWSSNPDANIAVKCRDFWVLDIDPRSRGDQTINEWTRVHGGLPLTWTARTGSGGTHYYFQHEEFFEAIPLGKLVAGIDVKGDGRHYVLVPPSRNKRGPYRWIRSPRQVPLAAAPQWLVKVIVRIKTPTTTEPVTVDMSKYEGVDRLERARRYARSIPGAIEGSGGDNHTWLAAIRIARGFALSEREAYDVMATEFNPRCQPPWSEKALLRHVKRALEIGDLPKGALLERKAS